MNRHCHYAALALGSVLLTIGQSSLAQSTKPSTDQLKRFLGNWFEAGSSGEDCTGNFVEIVSAGKSLEISGGSYDTQCTWKDISVIAQSAVRIPSREGELLGFSLKSQCETIDVGKDPPSVAIVIFVRKEDEEELFVGSAGDVYAGHYHRCKR